LWRLRHGFNGRSMPEYTFTIFWCEPDRVWVGECLEFPSLSSKADTPREAMAGVVQLVEAAMMDMPTTGEGPPASS
jgi:predicted RNase H-like HicB family nuclease